MPPHFPVRPRFDILLFNRLFTALMVAFLGTILLGCMSLSFGTRNYEAKPEVQSSPKEEILPSDGVPYTQDGTVAIAPESSKTVYYPVPYASPPNLSLKDDKGKEGALLKLVEQRRDRFTVRNTDWAWDQSVKWVATGTRPAPLPPPGPPEVPGPVAAPPGLPPTPIPIGAPQAGAK